jgi:hypothetical protein
MNRHQRRAAAKSASEQDNLDAKMRRGAATSHSGPSLSGETAIESPVHFTADDLPRMQTSSDSTLNTSFLSSSGNRSEFATRTRPGLALRLFSRIILSNWILSRVRNPEVERLLMSVAFEAGRTDVVDELTRREALRRVPTIQLR